jgi:hypothetical protein
MLLEEISCAFWKAVMLLKQGATTVPKYLNIERDYINTYNSFLLYGP